MRKKEQPPLVCNRRFIGFQGYNPEGMFCLEANGDNNFLLFGIAEGSLLLVDPRRSYQEGCLNVFRTCADDPCQWKLSLTDMEDFVCAGRVVLSVMQYD